MFDPDRALRTFNRHDVRYLLIGGYAAGLLGAPVMTNDIDVCCERSPENLERLAAALAELGARWRAPGDEDLPIVLDPPMLAAGDSFTFDSDAGPLDVLGTPSGTRGFADLDKMAATYDLGEGLIVRVAGLDDLIRMKIASGRRKDLLHLPLLEALRDEIGKQEDIRQQ